MIENIKRLALVSPCGKFRYRLGRKWDIDSVARHLIHFVMLNPSTADADIDDPTIRKCMGFADRLGFNEIRVTNLYAYRATDPKDLARNGWQIGPDNDHWLSDVACDSHLTHGDEPVVLAWGANARGHLRAKQVVQMMQSLGAHLFTLHTLGDGTPAHPLMLPYSCRLTPYSQS
jgi:hypothetical protein